jgi:hypothetical protein
MKTIKFLACSLVVASGVALTACGSDDSDGGSSLPPIGGYNSADEVGSADLVAYWPLNGDGKESKSGTMPNATQGASYVASTKGQSLKLTNGYLGFPAMTNLSTTMQSMSVSVWAKVTNNGGTDGHPTMLFQLSKPGDWAGNINLMSETGWYPATKDTLVMKGYVKIKNADGSENGQDVVNSPKPSAADLQAGHTGNANPNSGKWTHYIMTWDAPTGTFRLYANGQKISNAKYEVRGGGNALPLNFFTPTRAIIGTFAPVIDGTPDSWQRPMTGELDEIRVWKKALNQADVNALYELEKAGR